MALRAEERKTLVDDLVTNCDCWKAQGDRELLNTFSDDKLVGLKAHADQERQAIEVANAAVRGFSTGDQAFRLNPETGKWESRLSTAAPTTNQKAVKKTTTPTDADEPTEPEPLPTPRSRRAVANSPSRRPTSEEWMRDAPPEVQAKLTYLQQVEQREKDKAIARLLVNVADGDKRAHAERLQRRSLEDLMNDLALVPTITPTEEPRSRSTNNSAKSRQIGSLPVDDDILALPEMWKEVGSSGVTTNASASGNSDLPTSMVQDEDEEEWFRKAPAGLRARVTNAMQIENQQRNQMIEELIANFQGEEEQESRLVQRLQTMSIDALRDFLSLQPKRSGQTNNYGSSIPLANANTRQVANDVNEDVLPLPVQDWTKLREQA